VRATLPTASGALFQTIDYQDVTQMNTRLFMSSLFRSSMAGMAIALAVVNAQAGELLPFPSQAPVQQQQYSQPFTQDIRTPASSFADKYAEFSQRISGYTCKDLNNLIEQLRTSHANAGNESRDYYKGLMDIANKKRRDLNCTE
jgi:hypothetical protein